MKKRVSPTLIGAFVVGALVLVVAAVVLLGSAAWFSQVYRFVLYFDDSVDGLVVGAPVKFKGVQIGNVEQILLSRTEELDRPRIAVIIAIDQSRVESLGGSTAGWSSPDFLKQAIQRGLRAKLASQSLLTGLLYVSLNFETDAPPVTTVATTDSRYLEIPTVPSRVEQVAQTANDIFKKLQALDWQGLFDSISGTMDGLRKLVAARDTQNVTKELNETLESVQKLADRVNAEVGPLSASIQDVTKGVRASLEKIDTTVLELKSVIDEDSPLSYELSRTLYELEQAARSVRALADSLDRNPNQLIFGRE